MKPSISFPSIEVKHVDCHSSACPTSKKKRKVKKIAELEAECRVKCIIWKIIFFFFKHSLHKSLDSFLSNIKSQPGKGYPPAFPNIWKLWTVSILMNRFPKSPCNSMGPLYFNIRTLVFVMRTYVVRTSNSSTLSEVSILNFEYVYRVMGSEKLVRKLKVRISRST